MSILALSAQALNASIIPSSINPRDREDDVHVLVVEDEKKIASRIQKELEAQQYIVDVCHNGNDALDLIRVSSLDLIILDILFSCRAEMDSASCA